MEKSKAAAIDLAETYVSLKPSGDAATLAGGDAFWRNLKAGAPEESPEPTGTRLLTASRYTSDWKHWEMHPAGDELVYVVNGIIDFILETAAGPQTIRLTERKAVLVPRGVWHRANVIESGYVLHITPGAGTSHRPL